MRTKFVCWLLFLAIATPTSGQQSGPKGFNTVPASSAPNRIQLQDTRNFRSLRSGDANLNAPSSVQRTAYTPGNDEPQVPSILSGRANSVEAPSSPSANSTSDLSVPREYSMNQSAPPVSQSPGSTKAMPSGTSSEPPRQQDPVPGGTTSGRAFNPTMPAPGAALDLRAASTIQSTVEVPGRVQPVQSQDDTLNAIRTADSSVSVGTALDRQQPMRGNAGSSPVISAPGAAVQVSTAGPKSISVGKNSTYEITVVNNGSHDARQLTVTFSTPEWIEIANTSLTYGTKEFVRETDSLRILWRIDRLEPGKVQRLTLDVIPRKAQMFDLNVEWALAPVSGAVQVQVTEPMLKMEISGPEEVQFGQTALYNVAIRNPGTGVAENVNVILSEALGGERARLGNLAPGEEKSIQVELIARSAGSLELSATVTGDSDIQDAASRKITVRRPHLQISVAAPAKKYAGTACNFLVTIENSGDAMAQDVMAAIGLPVGVQYTGGIEAADRVEGGLRWNVGSLMPGAKRIYKVACTLNASGLIQIDAGVRGAGDLADAAVAQTQVETLADLVLTVEDPKGPISIGEDAAYQIRVRNRGTKAAQDVKLVMHFADGVEPSTVEGIGHHINPGEVVFDNIGLIEANAEVVFRVIARAGAPGAHAFRVQLTCDAADAREIAGGTTKFVADEIESNVTTDAAAVVGEHANETLQK